MHAIKFIFIIMYSQLEVQNGGKIVSQPMNINILTLPSLNDVKCHEEGILESLQETGKTFRKKEG